MVLSLAAQYHGLKLVMYEGGPSVMENGVFTGGASTQAITDKAIAFNQDPHIQRPVQDVLEACLLYTSPSPRDMTISRMPSSA